MDLLLQNFTKLAQIENSNVNEIQREVTQIVKGGKG